VDLGKGPIGQIFFKILICFHYRTLLFCPPPPPLPSHLDFWTCQPAVHDTFVLFCGAREAREARGLGTEDKRPTLILGEKGSGKEG